MRNATFPQANTRGLYRTLWRWHFYAGVFCLPFVLLLALTGATYLFKPYYESWREAGLHTLAIDGERLSPNAQIAAALAAVPESKFLSYRLPQADHEAVLVQLQADRVWQVFVNPYSGAVLAHYPKEQMLMHVVRTLHGELLLGNIGSVLVELAACWAIVLVLTGLYLWWPRQSRGLAGVLYPRLRQGARVLWRDLHAVTGVWLAALVLFLLVTGLPWALVWGAALKQVRSLEFSAAQGWRQGRQQEHQHWRAQASDLFNLTPAVVAHAHAQRLAPPVELSVADAHHGTWKAASQNPNRPLRADVWLRADGSIVKQAGFADKAWLDRAIGVGVAAHEGQLFGVFNLLLCLLTCVGLFTLAVSGFMHWRKRKPTGQLGAPPVIAAKAGPVILTLTLVLAVLLPLLGISIVVLLLLEWLVLRQVPVIAVWLGLANPDV